MKSEGRHLVTGTRLWLQPADAHGVRFDDACRPFDDTGHDDDATGDSLGTLHAFDRAGTSSATDEAAGSPADTRAVTSRPRLDTGVASSTSMSTRSKSSTRRSGSSSDVRRLLGSERCNETTAGPITARSDSCPVSEPELLLPDIPLIVEDFLVRAKQLADSGAPTEAIEAILDHVAALREGRG